MTNRILTLAVVAACLSAPAFAQQTTTEPPAKPIILMPGDPAEADANLQTTPETVKPASGSRCDHDKAVTS